MKSDWCLHVLYNLSYTIQHLNSNDWSSKASCSIVLGRRVRISGVIIWEEREVSDKGKGWSTNRPQDCSSPSQSIVSHNLIDGILQSFRPRRRVILVVPGGWRRFGWRAKWAGKDWFTLETWNMGWNGDGDGQLWTDDGFNDRDWCGMGEVLVAFLVMERNSFISTFKYLKLVIFSCGMSGPAGPSLLALENWKETVMECMLSKYLCVNFIWLMKGLEKFKIFWFYIS